MIHGALKDLRTLAGALFLAFAFLACSSSKPASTPATVNVTAQAMARGAVMTAEAIWDGMAQACIDAAGPNGDQNTALVAKCEVILPPARDSLVAAAGVLDAWTDARQGEVACALQDVMGSLNSLAPLLSPNSTALSMLTQETALTNALGLCNPDGGK